MSVAARDLKVVAEGEFDSDGYHRRSLYVLPHYPTTRKPLSNTRRKLTVSDQPSGHADVLLFGLDLGRRAFVD